MASFNDLPLGCDVAYIQKLIDWSGAKQDGVIFTFIRWTQGEDYFDSRAVFNWLASKSQRIFRGPYIVWDERRGAGGYDHFRWFLEKFRGYDLGELPVVIDLELKPINWDELRIFYDLLTAYFGRPPWLYSGAWILNQLDVPLWVQQMVHWLTGYNDVGPTQPKNYSPEIECWQQANNWQVNWVRV